jgi:hypothetical protein
VRAVRVEQLRSRLSQATNLRLVPPPRDGDSPAYYKLAMLLANDGRTARDRFVAAAHREGVAIDAGFRGFALRGVRRCRQATDLDYSRRAACDTAILHHPVLLSPPEAIDDLAGAILRAASDIQPSTQ